MTFINSLVCLSTILFARHTPRLVTPEYAGYWRIFFPVIPNRQFDSVSKYPSNIHTISEPPGMYSCIIKFGFSGVSISSYCFSKDSASSITTILLPVCLKRATVSMPFSITGKVVSWRNSMTSSLATRPALCSACGGP